MSTSLDETLALLQPIIVSLDALDSDMGTEATNLPTDGPDADLAKVKPLLDRLAALLDDSDSEAADVADELSALLKGSAHALAMQEISAAVADFDFDAAIERVEVLRQAF